MLISDSFLVITASSGQWAGFCVIDMLFLSRSLMMCVDRLSERLSFGVRLAFLFARFTALP